MWDCKFKISQSNTKVMAFRGKFPVRTKIVVGGRILEQVSHFPFLGCDISYEPNDDKIKKL